MTNTSKNFTIQWYFYTSLCFSLYYFILLTTVAFKCAIEINLTCMSLLLLLWLSLILKTPVYGAPLQRWFTNDECWDLAFSTRWQSFAVERADWAAAEFYICLLFSPYFYISAVFNHRNHYCGFLPETTYGSVETWTIGKLWHMLLKVQTKVCRVDVTLHLSKVSTGKHTSASVVLYVTGKCCRIILPDLIVTRVSCEVSNPPPFSTFSQREAVKGFPGPTAPPVRRPFITNSFSSSLNVQTEPTLRLRLQFCCSGRRWGTRLYRDWAERGRRRRLEWEAWCSHLHKRGAQQEVNYDITLPVTQISVRFSVVQVVIVAVDYQYSTSQLYLFSPVPLRYVCSCFLTESIKLFQNIWDVYRCKVREHAAAVVLTLLFSTESMKRPKPKFYWF